MKNVYALSLFNKFIQNYVRETRKSVAKQKQKAKRKHRNLTKKKTKRNKTLIEIIH